MHIPIHGSNSQTLKNKIKKYQIDISHFTGRAKSYTSASIDQYLVKDSNIKSAKLKEKITYKSFEGKQMWDMRNYNVTRKTYCNSTPSY